MKSKLQKGKFYNLTIKRWGRELYYKCEIKKIEKDEFFIEDEDGNRLHFYYDELVNAKEISEIKKEPVVVSFKSRIAKN